MLHDVDMKINQSVLVYSIRQTRGVQSSDLIVYNRIAFQVFTPVHPNFPILGHDVGPWHVRWRPIVEDYRITDFVNALPTHDDNDDEMTIKATNNPKPNPNPRV